MAPPLQGTCRSCKHAAPVEGAKDQFTCRARSPQLTHLLVPVQPNVMRPGQGGVAIQGLAGWPGVGAEDWCGDYQGKITLAH